MDSNADSDGHPESIEYCEATSFIQSTPTFSVTNHQPATNMTMNYVDDLASAITTALASEPLGVTLEEEKVRDLLEVPRNREMGDWAFPCFTLSKQLRQNPKSIAEGLASQLKESLDTTKFDVVEAAGPYVNFRISTADFASRLLPAILSGDFLQQRDAKNETVMIEYSQPNTHKAFHVGHTRNVALGDALVRICEWAGYDVIAANYIGDEGAHIAKCLWYYQNHFDGTVPDVRRGEFLGELYSSATELLDFTTITSAPFPSVVTAQVKSIAPIEGAKKNAVVVLDSGNGDATVVCGGINYKEGDIVAYAKPGSKINGRLVETAERHGVASEGMICSIAEIGQGDDVDGIYVFESSTELGQEITELFRVPGAIPDDVAVNDEINRRETGVSDVLKKLESGEPELTDLWKKTRQWSLDEFYEIYGWLNARFDHYFFESEVSEPGKKIVDHYLEKGVLVKSEGAVGADLTQFKLPFFILLRSDGTGLYSTKDLALAEEKFEKFGVDRSVYVVDASQSLHFQQVFKTLELMGFEQAQKCFHLAYGMVVLPDGKMSSRKGNVILFSQLRQKLTDRIREQFLDDYVGSWPDEEIEQASKRIAIATIKYGMLNHDNNRNIVFDLEEWSSQTGNTGPYLLYAVARINSILEELSELDSAQADWSLLSHEAEADLLRKMAAFPEVVQGAAEGYEPQSICVFLYELSKALNRFYVNCHVKNAETSELQLVRGLLISAAGAVLRQGLELLGIESVQRM